MFNMVAAGLATSFEFFAQPRQKSLAAATLATTTSDPEHDKVIAQKKARREAGCKVQGNLEELEN
jgi:hypothetical protein